MQDRPYQAEAGSAIVDSFESGYRRQLIAMATGTGKTVVFSRLIDRFADLLPGKMLVLAHTEELVDQAIEKLKVVNPTLKVDKEMAEHEANPATADIVVASVPTLGRKGTKRMEKFNWAEFDKIVVDEAHHAAADSYQNILNVVMGEGKLLLGVTATPFRADGKTLAETFQRISFVYSIRKAIEEGYLSPIRGYRVTTATVLDDVKKYGADFQVSGLAEAINTPERNRQIVQAWKGCDCDHRQTIVFTADIAHAQALCLEFVDQGYRAAAIWGDDPDRAQKLADHKDGVLQVLVNCQVLTEGYDDPNVACIILARPTMSGVLYTQMVGRGTRIATGKLDCVVLDVVDNCTKHSLVTLPTLMGLPANLNLMGQSLHEAVQAIEIAQEQYPQADFSKLDDITKLKTFVEAIDMFEVRYPKEVEANSELRWYRTADGSYRLNFPNDAGKVFIFQNLLDRWEIMGYYNDNSFHGIRDTMEEAFQAADKAINVRVNVKEWACCKREASWTGKPASKEQLALLQKLYKGQTLPPTLTRGQAAHWIDQKLSKWRKK